MSSRLEFRDGNHSYWLADPAGKQRRVPSVTGIVGGTHGKPHLVGWAAKMAAEYAVTNWWDLSLRGEPERVELIKGAADRHRDAAALKGTQIHRAAEELLQGFPVDVPGDQVEQVEGFAKWWDRSGFTAVHTEVKVWSDRFAGTFDCAALDEWGLLWLLDWKTGKSVYPEMAVQLAGYAEADTWVVDGEDTIGQVFAHHAVVHITPGGVSLHKVHDLDAAAARWRHALNLYTSPKPVLKEVVS
jgi:hypothetical protein